MRWRPPPGCGVPSKAPASSTRSSASRLASWSAGDRRRERRRERRPPLDRHLAGREHGPGVDAGVDPVDREADGLEAVEELPEDGRAAAVLGDGAVVDVDRPVWRERERLLAEDRVVERDGDVCLETSQRRARLLAVQRRHADDLRRDVLERRALARRRVRAAEREADGCRRDPDAPQLPERAAQVAPADRFVEHDRPGPPREEARRDPVRVAREHDDVHVRKYSTSCIGQRALRWWRRSE